MIILIDSGNTRLKVGRSDGPLVSAQAFDNGDAGALADWLKALPDAPTLALGTNVAGPARAAAIEAALAAHGCQMRWVKSQAQVLGLKSRYTQPGQLGADRWVSMLGVLSQMPAPRQAFLLACFGTATTLDTVSADGDFEGGLILPGPALMRKSLATGTANLPLAHGTLHDFPTDTHQAISSGVAAAQAGAVLRQWLAGIRRYGDAPLAVYVAGGGWGEVAAETTRLLEETSVSMGRLPPEVRLIENPVLDGLAYLADNTDIGAG
jgi:type III pantothenate kinase